MLSETPRTTALIEEHRRAGAKFMLFQGWKLPREFGSAREEHLFVRKSAGLFDISHMGEIRVQGPGALTLLQKTLTNQVDKLKKNQAQYNLMCNERGGVVDDLILYCLEPESDYLLCVNAGCREKDFNWLKKHNSPKAILNQESAEWAGLSLQGPKAGEILTRTWDAQEEVAFLKSMKKNQCGWVVFEGQKVLVCRTGYTGERGFEMFLSPQKAPALWRKLLKRGKEDLCPVGLSARDTLRLESQYPLYGKELSEDIDPHSAGLSWAVRNTTNFIGCHALSQIQVSKKRVAFKLLSPLAPVPRTGCPIHINGQRAGEVTSGAFSPTLSSMTGMGYVRKEKSTPGTPIQVQIREELYPAQIVSHLLPTK